MSDFLEVFGAREHNLKNIDVSLPRHKLVVITGVSGSGKSSLAFDTIYAEGQRRYMESFSAYARSFMGGMERPAVDKINGLSPVIAIQQKTTTRNPRSTVGTTTEIYDFLRVLYARAGEAYSYVTGERMVKQSEDQIIDRILQQFQEQAITLLAPIVSRRKGHYRELFAELLKKGYTKVRVDGEMQNIEPKMQLDRYKAHDIELVVDRIQVRDTDRFRLAQSVNTALKEGDGLLMVAPQPIKKSAGIVNEETEGLVYFSKMLVCPTSGISYSDPAPNNFSFNTPVGCCPSCKGLGVTEEITPESIMPNQCLSISRGGIAPLGEYRDVWIFHQIEAVLKKYKLSLTTPINKLPAEVLEEVLYGSNTPIQVSSSKYQKEYVIQYEGVINHLKRHHDEGNEKTQDNIQDYIVIKICSDCKGARLNKEALHFRIDNQNIHDLSFKHLDELDYWLIDLEVRLTERQRAIASGLLVEIRKRVKLLLDIGLDYLSLDRPLKTLSGGEAQRIRLATQIGTQLVGVLYILDEPSIGLHARDNVKLIQSLKELRDLGNSVIVVEHDKEMMLESDFILDIGKGAGIHGGRIVAQGTPKDFLAQGSTTAQYLIGTQKIEAPAVCRQGNGKFLVIEGATGNNLKNVTLEIPLGKMIAVTGVSGSGKSTLVHDTLFPILNQHFFRAKREPLPHKQVLGLANIDKVIEVDQSPIGRTPRSNPATYVGFFTEIRNLFAQLPESKIRGYKAGRFSFNVKGGRCEECKGGGMKIIEMEFLPDVNIVCENCKSKRYNRETLEVRFKSKSIADILNLTVEQAVAFFENQPLIRRRIQMLQEVGLGYLTLGQSATTLSGGEAQRVKLATELSRVGTGKTLYILDEPTTGLHFEDVRVLLGVLNKLVDKGNTVLIIEHNLDVIKVSDHVIDVGPDGGERGGEIIFAGTPNDLAQFTHGFTGKFLKLEM